MKHIIAVCLLLFSTVLHAQTNSPQNKPPSNNTNPAIPVSKSVNTTVINNQPASMPGSNTNPTTGTVISLKKNTSNVSKPVIKDNYKPAATVKNKSKKKKKSQ